MLRFFYSQLSSAKPLQILSITGAEGHHAADVLRAQPGEKIELLDGHGTIAECHVTACQHGSIQCQIISINKLQPPAHSIVLAQSLLKGKNFELVIEKTVELGVSKIVPILTQRTVTRLEHKDLDSKILRWSNIARETLKQCGGAWLPEISPPLALFEFIKTFKSNSLLTAAVITSSCLRPDQILAKTNERPGNIPSNVVILIGPEGDFSPQELEFMTKNDVQFFSLGDRILRAETAAIVAVGVFLHELEKIKHSPD
jgi:16S rRNA (uracil1498-N3)-methyltransferase